MDSDGRALQPPILRFASRPTDDPEMPRFMRRRLLVHLWLMAAVFVGLYVGGLLVTAVFFPGLVMQVHRHPAKVMNVVLPVVLLGIWALVRRRELSLRALRACDFVAQFTIAASIGFGVATAPAGFHLELAGLLVFVFTLVLRAAFVPSTVTFTAGVGLACSIPIVLGGYWLAERSPLDWLPAPLIAVMLTLWCVAATASTVVVSRVIYGLITQVREAMHLGRYTLVEQIGEGGMGAVYRAEHAMLRRPTAIKLLLPGRVSPEALARFEREVQLTSRLSHPNTVAIYDYGRTPDGVFYYAMEYLDGISLEQLVADDGPQPESRVMHLLGQVAGALAEAHGIGLIHRDIKPANIMLCERGGMPDVAKVVDFGLVKKVGSNNDQVTLTATNTIAGTPHYLAPESITRPDLIDARADLYALGAVGYFLLTGAPPFAGRSIVEICGQHLHSAPEPPSQRLGRPMNTGLEALLLACLAKTPENRPRDALDFAARLAECDGEQRWSPAAATAWWARWREKNPQGAGKRGGQAHTATVARDVA